MALPRLPAHTSPTSPEPAADEVRMYRVAALDADATTEQSAWSNVVTYPAQMHTHVAASGTIRDRTVTVDTMTTVDAAMYFSENTGATYAAMSDMPMYATVAVSGSIVTITGVAEGTAMITVTATSGAVEATQEFMVTVEAANTAPTMVGTIAAVTVKADQMSEAMDVSGYFSDADMGDTLTYTAMSDMEMYATAEIGGDDMNMLTITGVAAGMATITVTATDMDGAYAMQTIMVTVTPAELGMATNLRTGINTGGTIQVTWDAADNAVGYIVIAIDKADNSVISAPINPDSAGITATTWNLGGLTVGNDYYIYVAATGSAGDNTLSIPPLEVTAN